MQSTFKEKRQFLLDHPKYVLDHVSLRFALSYEQLRKYRNILSWDLLVCNPSISWNTDMVDELLDELFPKGEPYWPESFSLNRSLPWDSIAFVTRYKHLWDWQAIAENDMLKGECRAYYLDRLMEYDSFRPKRKVLKLNLDPNDPINSWMVTKEKQPEPTVMTPTELDALYNQQVEEDEIRHDEGIVWTLPLLKRYIEIWGTANLYRNPEIWKSLFEEFEEEENLVGVLDEMIE